VLLPLAARAQQKAMPVVDFVGAPTPNLSTVIANVRRSAEVIGIPRSHFGLSRLLSCLPADPGILM
jgi:hypothetical protein